jgi:hypothetical protein
MPLVVWNIPMFHPAKDRPGDLPSAADWNMEMFQMRLGPSLGR